MKKSLGIMSVAVAATLLLAGCSGGGDAASSDSAGGATGEPLTVAFPVPLTSGNKATAEEMVNAAQLAVDSINAEGGAGGRELKLQVYDDLLTADESAKIAQRALTVDGAEVFVGGYTTIEGLAIRQVADRKKVVYLAPSTVSPQLTEDAEYTFRVAHIQTDYPNQMAVAAQDLGWKRPVVVHDDGASGTTLTDPINAALEDAGIEPLEPVGFALNSTDLSATVSQVASENPDGIFLVGSSAADAGLLIKTLAEQGLATPVVGFSSPVAPDSVRIGGDAFDTIQVYSIQNKQPDKPLYTEFAEAYAAEYGGDPVEVAGTLGEAAGQTWDAFQILKQALDGTGGVTDGDTLVEAIRGLEPFEGVAGKEGGVVSLADSQNAYTDEMVTLIRNPDGTLSALEP